MKFIFTTTLFIGAGAALIVLSRDSEAFTLLLAGLALFYITFIALASFSFRWNFFLTAIHQGVPGKIVLTFDDGPHPEHTPAILDTLRSANVKAAFFLIGKNAAQHPGIVQKIISEGHEIGNHSFHHSNMHGFLSTASVVAEIEGMNTLIQKITGSKPVYYRPPFGVTNPNIAKAIIKTGMSPIGWDFRSYDTALPDKQRLMKRVRAHLRSSTILLFHDLPVTASILPEILDFCRKNGIEIVSLSEALKNRP